MSRFPGEPTGEPIGPFSPPVAPEQPLTPKVYRDYYITGIGRSGTTVAALLMNLHPDCRITLEAHTALDFLQAFNPGSDRTPERYHIRTMWYGKIEQGYHWGLHHSLHGFEEEQLVSPLDAARSCYESIWKLWNSPQVFGDKSPMYCIPEQRERLLEVVPGTRFIVMVRPLEQCIESLLKRPWGVSRVEAVEHYTRMSEGLKTIQECIYVELEWLQRDPLAAVGAMLEWTGLEPDRYPWQRAIDMVNGERVS